MPRRPRAVFPGVAHHITQRGNNRQLVFFSSDDRHFYLDLLRHHAVRSGNRLTGATASGQTPWAETYAYDGFGNLTAKNATLPPAPTFAASYDINNHQVGMTYDANGNQLWDSGQHATAYGWNMENKLATTTSQGWPGAETWYSYDPFGRRVMQDVNPDPNGYNGGRGFAGGTWQMYFYAITGQKIETLTCGYNTGDNSPYCGLWSPQYNVYFGGKLIETNGTIVVTDRLGSVRARSGSPWTTMAYYPYGEEYPSPTQDGIDKFGTYFRDGPGQDYAGQRYYNNGTGRFWSVDPGGMATADQSNPVTLNRYAYVNNDPANFNDRHGLFGDEPTAQYCIAHPDDVACYGPCETGGLPQASISRLFLVADPGCDPIVLPPGGGGAEDPAPTCTVELEYRAAGITGVFGRTHASLVIEDSFGFIFTIQGEPQNYPFPPWGSLVISNTQGNINDKQWVRRSLP